MSTQRTASRRSPDSSPSSADDPELEILGRCLDDLGGAGDKAAVVADYCARYPDLADKIRDLARVGEVLGDTTSWGRRATGGAEEPAAQRPPTPTPHPSRFGPYRVLRSIGRGGMGEVYEAEEDALHRHVAVKTIRRARATDPGLLERFDRERQVLARLHHTHIVPILATGQEDDLLYFAMPYIPGIPLNQVIRTAQRHSHENGNSPLSSFETLFDVARSESTPVAGGPARAPGHSGRDRSRAGDHARRQRPRRPDPPARLLPIGRRDDGRGRRGAAPRPRGRDHSPRPEALEHHGRAHRPPLGPRLRPRPPQARPGLAALDQRQRSRRVLCAGRIAMETGADVLRSLTVGTVGTLPYMAPEQIRKGRPARRSGPDSGRGP